MDSEKEILIFVVLSSLIVFMMIFGLVYFIFSYHQKQRLIKQKFDLDYAEQSLKYIKKLVERLEVEKSRISNDLHDDIGPMISILMSNLDEKSKDSSISFSDEKELLSQIGKTIRNACHDLSPSFVRRFGFLESIEMYAHNSSLPIVINLGNEVRSLLNGENVLFESYLFRIFTELLNNILKYGQTEEISLFIEFQNSEIKFLIEYKGNGLSNNEFYELLKTSKGLGLISIKERLAVLNGEIKFEVIDENICRTELQVQYEK